MIGPHEGKELDLMLSGEKHLAAFVMIADEEPDERIIPEQAFNKPVQNGQIIKFTPYTARH